MSLTLTAGDLASGHVPDLGEFQVLLSTVIQLINPASWLRPTLLLFFLPASQREKQIQTEARWTDSWCRQHCTRAKNGNWQVKGDMLATQQEVSLDRTVHTLRFRGASVVSNSTQGGKILVIIIFKNELMSLSQLQTGSFTALHFQRGYI